LGGLFALIRYHVHVLPQAGDYAAAAGLHAGTEPLDVIGAAGSEDCRGGGFIRMGRRHNGGDSAEHEQRKPVH
jgi:hypothetical protein